jgi:hypothetical protein
VKVGDLVAPQFWCKNKGRLAIVVLGKWCDEVVIQYLSSPYERSHARQANLELISETEKA